MAAAQGGDRAALDTLLRRHHDRLYALCRRLTGSDADAADALQEALIALVRGLPRFDGRAAFSTWAYRVATNASLDELRRRRRRPDPVTPESIPARVPGDEFSGVDARLDIDSALSTIHPDYRAAVVLRDLCGLAYDEIAEVLGVPTGTVRSRIARGRDALARSLEPRAAPGNPAEGRRRPTSRP